MARRAWSNSANLVSKAQGACRAVVVGGELQQCVHLPEQHERLARSAQRRSAGGANSGQHARGRHPAGPARAHRRLQRGDRGEVARRRRLLLGRRARVEDLIGAVDELQDGEHAHVRAQDRQITALELGQGLLGGARARRGGREDAEPHVAQTASRRTASPPAIAPACAARRRPARSPRRAHSSARARTRLRARPRPRAWRACRARTDRAGAQLRARPPPPAAQPARPAAPCPPSREASRRRAPRESSAHSKPARRAARASAARAWRRRAA
mmetsp:Transcript_24569/g.58069  ORF Transcript_24569/g.58069 Transcript_24569/m.58069 type:complete len:271 (-) Transcript_24569:268-1080(-)